MLDQQAPGGGCRHVGTPSLIGEKTPNLTGDPQCAKLALLSGGMGFSITALMGVLMVVGIAVSNGIFLIDHARVKLDEGFDKLSAILDAARTRFVPIAMTSLATVIGLIPIAMGLDRGAEANRPLALAVVGGLTSWTLLSLFLVPVIFMDPSGPEDPDHDDVPNSSPVTTPAVHTAG